MYKIIFRGHYLSFYYKKNKKLNCNEITSDYAAWSYIANCSNRMKLSSKEVLKLINSSHFDEEEKQDFFKAFSEKEIEFPSSLLAKLFLLTNSTATNKNFNIMNLDFSDPNLETTLDTIILKKKYKINKIQILSKEEYDATGLPLLSEFFIVEV